MTVVRGDFGGHRPPLQNNASESAADIRRRFKRSLEHRTDDYLSLADRWAVWDSRSLPAKRLAISAVDDIKTVRTLIGT
jgi:predicted ABC-type ATPase